MITKRDFILRGSCFLRCIGIDVECIKEVVSIVLTKTTAAQNEVTLGYHKVHGQYFLAVVFAATIV